MTEPMAVDDDTLQCNALQSQEEHVVMYNGSAIYRSPSGVQHPGSAAWSWGDPHTHSYAILHAHCMTQVQRIRDTSPDQSNKCTMTQVS